MWQEEKEEKEEKEEEKWKDRSLDHRSLGEKERIIKNRGQSSMFRRECSARRVRR